MSDDVIRRATRVDEFGRELCNWGGFSLWFSEDWLRHRKAGAQQNRAPRARSARPLLSTHALERRILRQSPGECAGLEPQRNWPATIVTLLGIDSSDRDICCLDDGGSGNFRAAVFRGGMLVGAFFAGRQPVEVSRVGIASQLGRVPTNRNHILAGRPADAGEDGGPGICVCMGIGRTKIWHAARLGMPLETLCQTTGAGTSCGSCRPRSPRSSKAPDRHHRREMIRPEKFRGGESNSLPATFCAPTLAYIVPIWARSSAFTGSMASRTAWFFRSALPIAAPAAFEASISDR